MRLHSRQLVNANDYRPLEFIPESKNDESIHGTWSIVEIPLMHTSPQRCLVIRFVTLHSTICDALAFLLAFPFHMILFLLSLVARYIYSLSPSRSSFGLMQPLLLLLLLLGACCVLILVICARLANIMRMSSKILFHPFWSVLFLKRDFSNQPYSHTHTQLQSLRFNIQANKYTDIGWGWNVRGSIKFTGKKEEPNGTTEKKIYENDSHTIYLIFCILYVYFFLIIICIAIETLVSSRIQSQNIQAKTIFFSLVSFASFIVIWHAEHEVFRIHAYNKSHSHILIIPDEGTNREREKNSAQFWSYCIICNIFGSKNHEKVRVRSFHFIRLGIFVLLFLPSLSSDLEKWSRCQFFLRRTFVIQCIHKIPKVIQIWKWICFEIYWKLRHFRDIL